MVGVHSRAGAPDLQWARELLGCARSDRLGGTWEVAAYLASQATTGGPAGEVEVLAVLRAARADDWLHIDAAMRWRYGSEPAFPASAEKVLGWLKRPTLGLALVASMHCSGYVREAAVRWLAAQTAQLTTLALVLRAGDWVAPVRERAAAALESRLVLGRPEELLAVAPLALVMAGQIRGGVWAARLGRLLRDPSAGVAGPVAVRALLGCEEAAVRRFACGIALELDLLSVEELVATALRDLDQAVKLLCGERAVIVAREAGRRDLLVRLLEAHTAGVRYASLRALTAGDTRAEFARRCLFDRSRLVRELAQGRLVDADIDPAELYRRELLSPSGALQWAITGLAETAGRDATALVVPFLANGRAAVRKAAARAVLALAPDDAVHLLEPMVADPSPGVTRVVVRLLVPRAGALDPDQLRDWSGASHPTHVRVGALRLLQALPGWQRVHTDLEAATDPDPKVRSAGISDLRHWLHLAAPTTYARPSSAERDRLLFLTNRAGPALPDLVARKLRFYIN